MLGHRKPRSVGACTSQMFAETFRKTSARSDNMFVSVVLLSAVQRFFCTLKNGHKPETFLFFEKTFNTF